MFRLPPFPRAAKVSSEIQPPALARPSNNFDMMTETALSGGWTRRRAKSARRAIARPRRRTCASSHEEIPQLTKLHHLALDSTPLTRQIPWPPRHARHLVRLIATTGLEIRPTHSKQSPLRISNRDYIAVFQFFPHPKSSQTPDRVQRNTACAPLPAQPRTAAAPPVTVMDGHEVAATSCAAPPAQSPAGEGINPLHESYCAERATACAAPPAQTLALAPPPAQARTAAPPATERDGNAVAATTCAASLAQPFVLAPPSANRIEGRQAAATFCAVSPAQAPAGEGINLLHKSNRAERATACAASPAQAFAVEAVPTPIPEPAPPTRSGSIAPSPLVTDHSPLITGFLIGTPRLEFSATPTKQSSDPISNRDTLGVLRPPRQEASRVRNDYSNARRPSGFATTKRRFPPAASRRESCEGEIDIVLRRCLEQTPSVCAWVRVLAWATVTPSCGGAFYLLERSSERERRCRFGRCKNRKRPRL